MKKMLVWVLFLSMLFCAVSAVAEGEAVTVDQLAGMTWCFSSGAGGWSTDMQTAEGGEFSGTFHDSEMGEADEAYPDGTVYTSAFSGTLSVGEQVDEYAWRVHIDSLTMENAAGEEWIDDDIRFVATDPYGIREGDDFVLYVPGTPVAALTEDMRMWAHLLGDDVPDTLSDWFMYSAQSESGFVGYPDMGAELANPWADLTAEELAQASGVSFDLPEGAENAVYRWLADEGLAEMQFTLEGGVDEFCARAQAAELEDGALMNISGMYFQWEHEEEVTVNGCPGTLGIAQTGSEDFVELCQWYDAAAKRMYALSVSTTDPDGLDLVAVAQMVFH